MFTQEQVDEIFDNAKHQGDYVFGLYRLVYGDRWDDVVKVNGYPSISSDTNTYIFDRAIKFDKVHHPEVFAGGIWMNQGFSQDSGITEWGEFVLPDTTYKGD